MAAGLQGDELAAAIERIESSAPVTETVTEHNESVTLKSAAALRQKRYRERHKRNETVTEHNESVTERNVSDHNINTSLTLKEESKKDYSPKRNARYAYTATFETFWHAYPTDKNMGKLEAFNVFKFLSPEDQQAAIASIPSFKTYLAKNPDQRVVHACRYLKWRRFDGFNSVSKDLSEERRAALLRELSA
jgi:hypothetical protein